MGNPLHFSAELPQHCLQLIDELWPHVEKIRQAGRPELGLDVDAHYQSPHRAWASHCHFSASVLVSTWECSLPGSASARKQDS
jgi:hypothetical protein